MNSIYKLANSNRVALTHKLGGISVRINLWFEI